MYTSIVVPLDCSSFGRRAVPVALALARRSDAVVHLVHVQDAIPFVQGGPVYDTRLHDELRAKQRSDLKAVAAQLTRDTALRVTAEFLDGPVVAALQGYLADHRQHIVVMMTHGRGGLSRAWLGSVADGLIRNAPLPLLLMRGGTECPDDLVEPLFRHVLVPLDGSSLAEEVLSDVVALGTPDSTSYTLLTVVVPMSIFDQTYPGTHAFNGHSDVEHQRQAALAYLTRVANDLEETGAHVNVRVVVHQRPAECILAFAGEQRADLIALSTHGHGAMSRVVHGSVADKIVRGATGPVLVYRPPWVGADAQERRSASNEPQMFSA